MHPLLSRPPLINAIQHQLSFSNLPGITAHLGMAHPIRRVPGNPSVDIQKEAGVLITLFEKTPGDFHVIFIRRGSSGIQDKHAGQIGFPGGRREDSDRDLMFTALREAEEEIGLDLTKIDVLGALTPLYITVSKYLVHPFVAYSAQIPYLSRQESEIEEILQIPLSLFKSQNIRQTTRIPLSEGITLNHVPCFLVDNHVIWGATAMILNELLEVLS